MGVSQEKTGSVTGAFEGWFPNSDGSYSILVGYFNRNLRQAADIPIGPDNQIQPGGPDQGQPTHFLPGRGWGLFTINVPSDWGDKTLTWTLTVNGITTEIPMSLASLWRIAPFTDATGDTAAFIGFSDQGPFVNGPVGQSESLIAIADRPMPLTVWVTDDAKAPALPSTPSGFGREHVPVSVEFTLYRGSGAVRLEDETPMVTRLRDINNPPNGAAFFGKTTAEITFSQPGDYILSIQAWDSTGRGGEGFQCCFSDAKVNVTVKPAGSNNH